MAAFTDQVNVKMNPEDRAWLKARAKAEERTISGQLRHMLQVDREQVRAELEATRREPK